MIAAAASLFLVLSAPLRASEPRLEFLRSDRRVSVFTLSEIKALLKPAEVGLADPFYGGRPKRYAAFPLKALLDLGFGAGWREWPESEGTLRALDGYESFADAQRLAEEGGYVAFDDLDREGWEPIGHKKADPGPFYVFWTGKDQTMANAYPWPWQLSAIRLSRFEEQYGRVFPKGAAPGSPALRGYEVFRQQCFRCHAIDRQGGIIGPDLGAPRNIVSYLPEGYLREFIRAPSKFRHSNMPDHEHLTDTDLDTLLAYFRHLAGKK